MTPTAFDPRTAALAAALALLAGCAQAPSSPAPAAAPAAAPAPPSQAAQKPPPALPASHSSMPSMPATAAHAAFRPGAAASAPQGPAGAASAPPAGGPGQPPAFDVVIKDAKKIDGLFTLWQKDDKVWIELSPDDFGKPLMLSPKISQGIGEAGLFGGTMIGRWGRWGRAQLVEFKRVHNLVQLLARNTEYTAPADTPEGRAVKAGFSPSLLATTGVASQPHAERKTVLVEAGPLFIGDMLGLGIALQRQYRQGYAFDGRNSSFSVVRGKPDAVFFEVQAHFATSGIAQAQPGAPALAAPSIPGTLPDARSMFFGLHYSLSRLPAEPMRPRLADPRVGYFSTTVQDFSDDLSRTPRQRFVNRWRLEKKDPSAAMSEPVKPIVFWLDRTVPLKYRDAISRGVLEWNKAFEKIGFRNAVEVKVQPDDAAFDTLDIGVASIRWMTNAQPQFGAIGPSQVDPRSGEILDADIGFESLSSRGVRMLRSQVLASRGAGDWAALMQSWGDERPPMPGANPAFAEFMQCQHADFAAEQLSYALDVLAARGEVDPGSPQAQQWVLDYLTDTTMHEVGHTLGLRHNFRSSRVYSDKQLSDAQFTRQNGLAGSVMEYAPINLARPGEPETFAWQTTLGPYDYWAIEYAYRPLAPEQEAAELKRIAARSAEPALAYGTDEDNFLGIDPETLQFDLGDDPVAFAQKRIDIARDLIRRQATRELKSEEDYSVLRRSVGYALRDVGRAVGVLARQIGGLRTLRDHPGSGRDPLVPVPAAVQRQALDTIARGVLSADALFLPPALLRRLAPDYQERLEALVDGSSVTTDLPVATMLIELQRALLAQLMSDTLAQRILDGEAKMDRPAEAFHLSELVARVTQDVWSDLGGRDDIVAARRELQREHVNRLAALLVRPAALGRADARSLWRVQAQALLARIEAAGKRPGLSAEARAHLQDSAGSLREALAAKMERVTS